MFKRLWRALEMLKREEKTERASQKLTDDPITVEAIHRIAKAYDYHFEIVQKDGTVLRFLKKTNGETNDPFERVYW